MKYGFLYYGMNIPFACKAIPRTNKEIKAVAKRQNKKRSLQRHRKGKV
jgi:hypothetical protein